jgi:hypothetical protein
METSARLCRITRAITLERPGPERHSNPDLLGALRNDVGHHTIESDCGKDQGEIGEGTEKQCAKTRESYGSCKDFLERLYHD